ncbi:putative ribose 5-phosphate isomerase [Colletotrichum orbiculare MAFF 240422]|uniref:Ribose 5-phosphate isomerase n=1 Tax=Colletotrichum orbiculare (strain 104-T / ATCC 96160 / CBS 514.97 / LARS 414 / MAFF 240422) TaxID=1213857 RepID=A0A484FDR0_COLOR|nr:putative ribose 5-phosphate isomerase [Colletotrichum orbiculare MAFF 240422]
MTARQVSASASVATTPASATSPSSPLTCLPTPASFRHRLWPVLGDGQDGLPYAHFALAAAETAAVDGFDRAVLICGTGLRVAISANKVPGVRAVDDFETVCRMIYLMSFKYPSANCTVS